MLWTPFFPVFEVFIFGAPIIGVLWLGCLPNCGIVAISNYTYSHTYCSRLMSSQYNLKSCRSQLPDVRSIKKSHNSETHVINKSKRKTIVHLFFAIC